MAARGEILKEFLVSLGFSVDEHGAKRFVAAVTKQTGVVGALATALTGATFGLAAMVKSFASGMESLYYTSRRTKESVGNIQALEFGAENIGLSADHAREMLEGMVEAMELSPGLKGLLGQLGVKSECVKGMIELVRQLEKMPKYQAAQYGQLFGFDYRSLKMLMQGVNEMERAAALRRRISAETGVDPEKDAAIGREYMNLLRQIGARF